VKITVGGHGLKPNSARQ